MAVLPSSSSSPSFTLRLGEPADFDAYMDAFEAVAAEGRWMGAEAPIDREARRPGFDKAVAADGAVLYLADAGGEIVGSVHASLARGVVDIGMFVADGYRGGGIGSALLEAVIDWARRNHAHKISLAAWPTNHAAIGLYARYGFRVEGTRRRQHRRRNGALWDSVVMGLVLDEETPGGPGPMKPPRPSIVLPDGRITDPGGSGIVLRPWRRADGPAIVRLVDDPEIRRWITILPNPYSAADADEFIAGTRVALTAGEGVPLAIVHGRDLVGAVDLRLANQHNGDIGYWVAAAARGRGVASTATRLLSDFGFEALGLRRVELNAAVGNIASRRAAEKAGFELEGVRRSWQLVDGVPADFAIYSRIANSP
ncbi:MAG: GNAT family N-acetyltransferase [Actinomycetota bacterium]|jgi:RimJ/RimL family protein N-acetyltransferase